MCSLEKRGDIYILTLTGAGEHRLSPSLLDEIQAALRRVRSEVTAGSTCSALITTAEGKFFSNGFDLQWAQGSPPRLHLMSSKLRSVIADLIHLPMPTIAAVTGHAAAGGFFLAIGHDYFLMRKDRGFLYLSELDIGMVFPEWYVTLLRAKVGLPKARWRVVLRAPKVAAGEAVEMGIVDSAHASAEETVAAAVKLGEELVGRKWNGEVYGQNRVVMLADVVEKIRIDKAEEERVLSKM